MHHHRYGLRVKCSDLVVLFNNIFYLGICSVLDNQSIPWLHKYSNVISRLMKDFLKDYGTLIGPSLAFMLGILAIYIKYLVDHKIEKTKSKRKLDALIKLIIESKPPPKFYPEVSKEGFIHTDQARNLTNISIFLRKITLVLVVIEKIENDVLINCSIPKIQQFNYIKFITSYLHENLLEIQDKKVEHDYLDFKFSFTKINISEFQLVHQDYERLLQACTEPAKNFNYITS